MNWDSAFRTRMSLSGTNLADGFKNNAVNLVNSKFADSPYYKQGTTSSGNPIDWREGIWKEDEPYNSRTFHLRPYTKVERGDTLNEGNDTWMVFEFNTFDDVYPDANMMLCNDKLNWKDANGTIHSYPCVTIPYRSVRTITSDANSLNMPQGHMFAVAQLNPDTQKILLKQRFYLGSQVYQISGIDDSNYVYNGKGMLYFTVSVDTQDDRSKDDPVNRIADNSLLYESQIPSPSSVVGSVNTSTPPTSNGGKKLW